MSEDRDIIVEALSAYELGDELGRGAWGVVIAGRHRELGREVAIKQLPPTFGADPDVKKRFRSEAKLLASLDHPHIVPVYDFVEHEGVCLLVMERLTGGTVGSRFHEEGFSQPDACAVVLATSAGLHHAHQMGVLHRDVKPENLMFSQQGVLKVTDFGIAKVMGGGTTMATRTGGVLGTPAYIAPEQAEGGELSPATDVYAVGNVLYELLSGSRPFPESGDPVVALFHRVYMEPVPLLETAPDVPPLLAEVVGRAIERDPDARFADAEQFGSALADAVNTTWGPDWRNETTIVLRGVDNMLPTEEARPGTPGRIALPKTPATGPKGPLPRRQTETPAVAAADLKPEDLVPAQEAVAEQAAGRQRRRRWVVGAAAAIVVAGVAAVLLATSGGGGGNSGPEPLPGGPTADQVSGTWSGIAESGDGPFDVRLSVRKACAADERCGRISVSSVPCSGDFSFVGRKGRRYEFSVDNFSANSGSSCTPGAGEFLTPRPNGTLLYTTSYDPSVKGTLQRAAG